MTALRNSLEMAGAAFSRETTSLLPPPPSALHRIFGAAGPKVESPGIGMKTESAENCREQIRRKLALRAAKSMPPLEMDMEKVDRRRRKSPAENGEDQQENEGEEDLELEGIEPNGEDEQFICRYCEKDFRRPDILSR